MQHPLVTSARAILGSAFVLFGLNGFVPFMPIPPAEPAAEELIGALIRTGYFFQMVKVIELCCGALLVSGLAVPLALCLLAPLLVGITSIHLFLNPGGLPLMALLLALEGIAAWGYRSYFAGMLTLRAVPDSTSTVGVNAV